MPHYKQKARDPKNHFGLHNLAEFRRPKRTGRVLNNLARISVWTVVYEFGPRKKGQMLVMFCQFGDPKPINLGEGIFPIGRFIREGPSCFVICVLLGPKVRPQSLRAFLGTFPSVEQRFVNLGHPRKAIPSTPKPRMWAPSHRAFLDQMCPSGKSGRGNLQKLRSKFDQNS